MWVIYQYIFRHLSTTLKIHLHIVYISFDFNVHYLSCFLFPVCLRMYIIIALWIVSYCLFQFFGYKWGGISSVCMYASVVLVHLLCGSSKWKWGLIMHAWGETAIVKMIWALIWFWYFCWFMLCDSTSICPIPVVILFFFI